MRGAFCGDPQCILVTHMNNAFSYIPRDSSPRL